MRLMPRHITLARLIAGGWSYKEIATKMGLTHGTVRLYAAELHKLTGLDTPVQIANWVHGNAAADVVRELKALGVAA